eukprot:snap_masked-scaffold_6-processed-gene-5.15-mRNA-1 protein AED:1.00 eAED:1.00 QI:0/0/0/0/1/1/2/0/408
MISENLTVENKKKLRNKNNHVYKYFFLGALVVFAVVGGVASGETVLSSQQDKIDDLCPNINAGEKVKVSSSDYISIVFDSNPEEKNCISVLRVASRLSKAIAGTQNVYNEKISVDVNIDEACGITSQNNSPLLKKGDEIIDLVVGIVLQPIDGELKVTGVGGPCLYNEKVGLPFSGVMLLDTADAALLQKYGKFESLVMHEMMHVLGFGVTWVPIPGYGGVLLSNFTVLEDAVYTYNEDNELAVHPENEPKYIGAEGVAEFEKLTGKSETFIPVQGVEVNGEVYFNVSTEQIQGSIDTHIDQDMFGNAMMTYRMDVFAEKPPPLTAMSLASLRDIGYTVDTSAADEYALPLHSMPLVSSLRGSTPEYVDFSNDVLKIEPLMLDLDDPNCLEQVKSRRVYSVEEVLDLA